MGKTIHNRKHYEDDYDDEGELIQRQRQKDIERRKKKGYKLRNWYDDAIKRDQDEEYHRQMDD